MTETAFVYIILAAAVVYVIYRVYLLTKGKSSCCSNSDNPGGGCGCCCKHCHCNSDEENKQD